MLVGVISDTHDNIWNLDKVVESLKERGIEALIHCGDFCAPFVLVRLNKVGVPVHCVFGNVDGDKYLMTRLALTELKNVTLYGELAEVEIGGRKVAFTHNPKLARALFLTKQYDAVFHGHTHEALKQAEDGRIILSPGEIMGMKGKVTFCLYDTERNEAEIITQR